MEGIINYVALGCSALALILDIVAIALPTWFSLPGLYYYGLWKFCALNTRTREETCGEITTLYPAELPDFIKATRALTILGLLLVAAAIAMAVLKIFVMKDKIFLSLGASASAIAAGGLILIGTIVFGVKAVEGYTANADLLGAGFRLAVVAGVIPVVAGIIFIIDRNK